MSVDGDVVSAKREIYSMRIEQIQVGQSTYEWKFSPIGDITSIEQLNKIVHEKNKPLIYDTWDTIYNYTPSTGDIIDMERLVPIFLTEEVGWTMYKYHFNTQNNSIEVEQNTIYFTIKE